MVSRFLATVVRCQLLSGDLKVLICHSSVSRQGVFEMRFVSLVCTVLWLSLTAPCFADETPVPAARSLPELDLHIAKIFKDGNVPGASLAVVENGQVVFVKGYGLADKAKSTSVTPDTMFRAASISKSFTGLAIMTAVQDGKLSLEGTLHELAPEVHFQNAWEKTDPIRLAHLIEHTTGWPDISFRVLTKDGPGWSLKRGVDLASSEFVSRWKPGHFSVYNNAGPAVAGVILEKATGQEFNAYMRDRVLKPMGILEGNFDQTPEMAARVAKSYNADGSVAPFQNIILAPAGSLNVSAKELAQVVRLFLGRGTVDGQVILSPESIARIERSESLITSKQGFAAYGYGLGNAPFPDSGVSFRGHNGGIDAFTSVYGYSVRSNSGYVILANGGEGVDIGSPAAKLVQDYLTRSIPPVFPASVAVSQSEMDKFAGVYRSVTPSSRFTQPYQELLGLTQVTVEQGKVFIGGKEFLATSEGNFRRFDREVSTVSFVESDGRFYKVGAFGSARKEPVWLVIIGVGVFYTFSCQAYSTWGFQESF